jgi:hypothetical protein
MEHLLKTTLAIPYHFRRNGVCYLRLRPQGALSDTVTVSLRTSDRAMAEKLAKDILKHLAKFHLGKPSATWKQLKARLYDIVRECLANTHGDASMAAYRDVHEKRRGSGGVDRVSIKKGFHITPRGIVESDCAIQKPDYGNPETGFGNPRGEYRANLTIPSHEAQSVIDQIVATHEANYKALVEEFRKNPPTSQHGRKVLKPYEGDLPFFENDDDTVTFKIKRYASYVDRNTQESKPLSLEVVDSRGTRMVNVPAIAGGSELKVKFSTLPYTYSAFVGASVMLRLEGVMLIKLVKSSPDDGGWANEAVEGGYVVTDLTTL